MAKTVTTITPLRISFAGGGTDFSDFYLNYGGAVLSSSINKYIYVTVKTHSPLFNEKYRLNYSETELVNSLDEIKNEIARECLKLVKVEAPLYISTTSDIPTGTGLGSSSSFATGLLNCLHHMRNEIVSPAQLAEEACQVELGMLSKPIGKQDQYSAAFGGMNFIEFQKSGRVLIDHIWSEKLDIKELFSSFLLLWTGTQRKADSILKSQKKAIPEIKDSLGKMKEMAVELRDCISNNKLNSSVLAKYLHNGWMHKRTLSPGITNSRIDQAYKVALENGALGGKLLGAGGGGFLLLVVPKEKKGIIEKKLPDFFPLSVKHEPLGSRLLSIVSLDD